MQLSAYMTQGEGEGTSSSSLAKSIIRSNKIDTEDVTVASIAETVQKQQNNQNNFVNVLVYDFQISWEREHCGVKCILACFFISSFGRHFG
jgi:hypothetical protein